MASGIAASVTIRISNFLGSKNYRALKLAGYSSFLMVIAFMTCWSICFIIGKNFIPKLYVTELPVIRIASSFIIIAAFYQIFDGMQVTVLGALRGLHDVKIPTFITLFSYWAIACPMYYFLTTLTGLGAVGVWYGYLIGLATAASLLFLRYRFVALRKARKQIESKN
jgi:MATE family multidrug resistance protein